MYIYTQCVCVRVRVCVRALAAYICHKSKQHIVEYKNMNTFNFCNLFFIIIIFIFIQNTVMQAKYCQET